MRKKRHALDSGKAQETSGPGPRGSDHLIGVKSPGNLRAGLSGGGAGLSGGGAGRRWALSGLPGRCREFLWLLAPGLLVGAVAATRLGGAWFGGFIAGLMLFATNYVVLVMVGQRLFANTGSGEVQLPGRSKARTGLLALGMLGKIVLFFGGTWFILVPLHLHALGYCSGLISGLISLVISLKLAGKRRNFLLSSTVNLR